MQDRLLRLALALLALGNGVTAVWASVAPRSFYDDFPGAGHWVSALPPYNEHLIRDYGSALLALAVLTAAAAILYDRVLVLVTLGVLAVAALPHLAYHVAHARQSGAGTIVSLALDAAVPLFLIPFVPTKERVP